MTRWDIIKEVGSAHGTGLLVTGCEASVLAIIYEVLVRPSLDLPHVGMPAAFGLVLMFKLLRSFVF